jgi:hypothetical protein
MITFVTNDNAAREGGDCGVRSWLRGPAPNGVTHRQSSTFERFNT